MNTNRKLKSTENRIAKIQSENREDNRNTTTNELETIKINILYEMNNGKHKQQQQ